MALSNLSSPMLMMLCITIIAAATLVPFSNAQNSPNDFVSAHNQARSIVGVGPVTWDTGLEAYARNYANQRATSGCQLIHSGGPYGENIAWGGSLTGTGAVSLWVSEKGDYNYNSNSCAPGKVCGHYTQVVWRNSVRIGCARVQCSNNNAYYFVICSYAPPGNYVGQKPY